MTEKLYDSNSHLKEFKAKVLSCEKCKVGYVAVLDKTAFFPEGGGQECDKGTIDSVNVTDVQIKEGIIYHYLENEVNVGKTVDCVLDWQRRFRNMQNHSGEHIVSGIVHKLYGYDNIGFHLGSDEMTLDFNGELTRDDLLKVEKLANEAIYINAKFTAVYPSEEELSKIRYRSKLDLTENVRIVTVEGYDVCACCAPHVNSACEIGLIKILDFCRNKGGVRLFVKCGSDALNDYNVKYNNIYDISLLLSVKQHETAEAVKKLTDSIAEMKYEIGQIKKRIISQKIESFSTENKLTVIFEDGLDIKELQLYSDGLNKKCPGIRAVFSGKDNEFSFAICGEPQKLDSFFKNFKQKLAVRGGGRNGMVQGTVNATKEQITACFSDIDK